MTISHLRVLAQVRNSCDLKKFKKDRIRFTFLMIKAKSDWVMVDKNDEFSSNSSSSFGTQKTQHSSSSYYDNESSQK
jgi:hypothetical protein